MLYVENVTINGKEFIRTWSDRFMIERDGVMYSDAIDPINHNRVYTETNIPLEHIDDVLKNI